jgi:hypothetical protein
MMKDPCSSGEMFKLRNRQRGTNMDKRTEYIESISAQMVEWDLIIDRLKDKQLSAEYGTEPGYAATIASLQHKRDQAALKLQGIPAASDDEWENVKTGSEQVMDEVRTMVADAITKIA